MVENDSEKMARAQRISEAIKSSGKTQREIADIIGVTPQSISKWTQTGSIQAENLWAFADAIHVDIRYLMFGETSSHGGLHQIIDQLSTQQAKQVALFVNTLLGCDDANMEFSLVFSPKSAD